MKDQEKTRDEVMKEFLDNQMKINPLFLLHVQLEEALRENKEAIDAVKKRGKKTIVYRSEKCNILVEINLDLKKERNRHNERMQRYKYRRKDEEGSRKGTTPEEKNKEEIRNPIYDIIEYRNVPKNEPWKKLKKSDLTPWQIIKELLYSIGMEGKSMKTAKQILLEFKALANSKGFTEKVVGDYAYKNPRTKEIMRFWSQKKGVSIIKPKKKGG